MVGRAADALPGGGARGRGDGRDLGLAEPGAGRDQVRHGVSVGTPGRLEVWVSASGFGRPGSGSLPTGTWTYECCPSQTAGTPAWHYRSSTWVRAGTYGFPALAGTRGTFRSTAAVAGSSSAVWVTIR